MPQIFKALATVSAWSLFVGAWLLVVPALVMGTIGGLLFVLGTPPPIQFFFAIGLAIIAMTLSVVVMKLRQMLE